jgi:threonine aldolase
MLVAALTSSFGKENFQRQLINRLSSAFDKLSVTFFLNGTLLVQFRC